MTIFMYQLGRIQLKSRVNTNLEESTKLLYLSWKRFVLCFLITTKYYVLVEGGICYADVLFLLRIYGRNQDKHSYMQLYFNRVFISKYLNTKSRIKFWCRRWIWLCGASVICVTFMYGYFLNKVLSSISKQWC